MNIKKKMPKLLSALLSFSMAFGTVIPAYATDVFISESELEDTMLNETELETASLEENMAFNESNEEETGDGIETQADTESRYEEVEVKYNQSSSYFVTIPKTIVLGADRKSPYSIKVEGDIVSNKQVCVVPVDRITDTEVFDFYMEDQIAGSTKDDVVAEVNQAKFYWNYEEAKAGYTENDNYIIAEELSAGRWRGVFQLEISMRTNPTHIHNYVGEVTKEPTCTEPGEKTYTCDCGDSYTEEIPAKGHHYENGTCTDCGDKDPNHEHKYTEKVTKEPTCTEEGEKTYTCDCGDSYTEKIPAKGHNYVDGECEHCGDKDPNHEHKYTEKVTKEPTCTEEGEKTYTCDCGDSYTEKIPAKGHNYIDGECEHCGDKDPNAHKHVWEENTDIVEWTSNDKASSSIKQTGNTWRFNYSANQYAIITLSRTWGVTVPEDMEYTFNYNSGFMYTDDRVRIYVDDEVLVDFSNSAKSGSETISLSAGDHTIKMILNKNNKTSTATYASITLNPLSEVFNHVCNGCGEKEEHIYTERIVKEPTCTEKGEREINCTKCGYSRTEEIEALGHHYVDGVCDRCGSLNLVSTEIWSAIAKQSKASIPDVPADRGHYDKTYLAGTYSPNIEITEDMSEDEYLELHFGMEIPHNGGGNGYQSELDGVNGSAIFQKYDEETGTWENVYSYKLTFNSIPKIPDEQGGYIKNMEYGVVRRFQLEKGTYRAYGNFSANRGCSSDIIHLYYSYKISVSLCKIEKEEVAETL